MKNKSASLVKKLLPEQATQGVALFKDLEILWKSQDARPMYIVKDSVNRFIINIYPPGGTTIARSMIDSYNKLLEFAESESTADGFTYTKISFQPQNAKVPRALSYGASIREAIALGRKLFNARKVDPIITITNSRNVAENIRIFGNTIVWIKRTEPEQKVYDFIHTYNRIAQDPTRSYDIRIEDTKLLFAQQKDIFAAYAGDIKKQDLPL